MDITKARYKMGNPNVLTRLKLTAGCSFCQSKNINMQTLTCKDCNTTMPRNYGANQRKDRHGNDIGKSKSKALHETV